MAKLLDNPKFSIPQRHFERACKASREHAELAARAIAEYGGHGALISGCVQSHFPEDVKNELRRLAREVTEESERGYSMRPRRVRQATMRRLAQEVATRDGAGFYGPQPIRSR